MSDRTTFLEEIDDRDAAILCSASVSEELHLRQCGDWVGAHKCRLRQDEMWGKRGSMIGLSPDEYHLIRGLYPAY